MSDDFRIVVIGASAGGVDALGHLVAALDPDLHAAIFVVMHVAATARSALPQILSRANTIPASHPRDGQRIQAGRIYVAPPDKHLLLKGDLIQLSAGPKENSCRPAIDPLFRSAADSFGVRVVGLILSGLLADGASGLHTIKSRGGLAAIQDPKEAAFPGMPLSAISDVKNPDLIGSIAELAAFLNRMCELPIANTAPAHDTVETRIAAFTAGPDSTKMLGDKSEFGCPECGGTLWEMTDDAVLRFRCRVGHAYVWQALAAAQHDAVEAALWSGMRALQEKADLFSRLSARLSSRGEQTHSQKYACRSEKFLEQSAELKKILDGTVNVSLGETTDFESDIDRTSTRGELREGAE